MPQSMPIYCGSSGGNIFVSYEHPEDPQYIGIDCGIVGSLNKEDKRYLKAVAEYLGEEDLHTPLRQQLHIGSLSLERLHVGRHSVAA
jgi:predicted unusual protein kinase regulating ubiquinone biosynthesis (AarF/ABC1/UbiB family)